MPFRGQRQEAGAGVPAAPTLLVVQYYPVTNGPIGSNSPHVFAAKSTLLVVYLGVFLAGSSCRRVFHEDKTPPLAAPAMVALARVRRLIHRCRRLLVAAEESAEAREEIADANASRPYEITAADAYKERTALGRLRSACFQGLLAEAE